MAKRVLSHVHYTHLSSHQAPEALASSMSGLAGENGREREKEPLGPIIGGI